MCLNAAEIPFYPECIIAWFTRGNFRTYMALWLDMRILPNDFDATWRFEYVPWCHFLYISSISLLGFPFIQLFCSFKHFESAFEAHSCETRAALITHRIVHTNSDCPLKLLNKFLSFIYTRYSSLFVFLTSPISYTLHAAPSFYCRTDDLILTC
jgi:hypothetical protein